MEHQQQTPTTHPQGVSCGQHQALRYLGTGLTQPGLTWRIPEIWISPLWYPHAIPIMNGYKGWYLMGIAWGSNISSEWNWSWPHGDAFHWNGNGIRGRNKPNSFMIAAIFSLVNYYNSARRNPKIWSLEWWELDWGNYPQAAELFRLVNCEILSRKMGDGSFWSFSHLNQLW